MSWQEMRLGSFLTLKRGYDLPTTLRKEGYVPVVSSSGITGHHNEVKIEGPGVVTGRCGTLGEVFFLEQDFWPLNTALYVQDFMGNDPRFSAYFLKSILIGTTSDKAAVPGVNRNDLHAQKIVVTTDTVEQKRIASFLSAYDDLIENNRRRMALLEEAARLLYREWFVYLRFPGYERHRIVDGVPDGWERMTLGELADITMGQSPESKYYNELGEGIPFHQGVADFGDRFVTNRIYTTALNRIACAGDILCSVRAPVGKLNITLQKIVIGRGLAALRSRINHQSLLYYQLRNYFFKEDIIGTGAIFASVTKREFASQKLLIPPSNLADNFEEITLPIDNQIRLLHLQNQKLHEARDLLLPRLMNGEITI